jgi:serine/threonine protein kinase
MYYFKKILKNSKEHKFLKEIDKKNINNLFLPIEKEIINGKYVKIYWKKIPSTVYNIKNKISKKNELLCWKQICSALSFLHSLNIIHFDVHLKNILVDKNKFYLIDFGISKKNQTTYDNYCLLWKEDEFQLLWNLIYKNNEYPSDFSSMRKKIQEESQKNKNLLLKEIQYCLPSDISTKYFSILLSKNPIHITTKIEKIKFKMFLQRLYLLLFIFIKKPNVFYKKMYHSLNWKN